MRNSFLIALALASLLACGCASDVTRKYNGKVGNLLGDGKIAVLNSECRGFSAGPAGSGKYSATFDLAPSGPTNPPTNFHLCFTFPTIPAGQILVTNTDSRIVDVLFCRSDAYGQWQFQQSGGERMAGRVSIKWNSDADFVIGADLSLPDDNSTWVRGEFVGSTKAKLNPILYEWPAILLFQESK